MGIKLCCECVSKNIGFDSRVNELHCFGSVIIGYACHINLMQFILIACRRSLWPAQKSLVCIFAAHVKNTTAKNTSSHSTLELDNSMPAFTLLVFFPPYPALLCTAHDIHSFVTLTAQSRPFQQKYPQGPFFVHRAESRAALHCRQRGRPEIVLLKFAAMLLSLDRAPVGA